MGKTYSKSLTPEERIRLAKMRARVASHKRAQDNEDSKNPTQDDEKPDTPDTDEDKEDEAEKEARFARKVRRYARRYARRVLAEDKPEGVPEDDKAVDEIAEQAADHATEKVVDEVKPDADSQEVSEAAEDAVEEAIDKTVAAYRRRANYRRATRSYRGSLRRRAQDDSKKEPENDPDAEDDKEKNHKEPDGDEVEARRRRAMLRARRFAYRRACQRMAAEDGAIDMKNKDEVSEDLAKPDEGDGGVSQKPQPETSKGQAEVKAEPDDANQDPQEIVLSAYDLIDAQIAHRVIPADAKKGSLASKYAKKYSAKQMRFATEQLNKVDSVGKTAGHVRVSRRGSSLPARTASKSSGIDSECIFY